MAFPGATSDMRLFDGKFVCSSFPIRFLGRSSDRECRDLGDDGSSVRVQGQPGHVIVGRKLATSVPGRLDVNPGPLRVHIELWPEQLAAEAAVSE
jgi:hypothetical protein